MVNHTSDQALRAVPKQSLRAISKCDSAPGPSVAALAAAAGLAAGAALAALGAINKRMDTDISHRLRTAMDPPRRRTAYSEPLTRLTRPPPEGSSEPSRSAGG